MRALVIHESLYGNTRRVAQEVAAGLSAARPDVEVRCLSATEVVHHPDALVRVDLLVLGCPTHAWHMSSVRSRTAQVAKDAAEEPERRHDRDATGPGLHEVIALRPLDGCRVAAFDTRLDSRFAGGAGKRIAREARAAGAVVLGDPRAFLVTGRCGPLATGELDRARHWGVSLGALLPAAELSPIG